MHAPARSPIPLDTLLMAYRKGIFPMSDGREDDEVFWVEPKERAIIPLDRFHCSRSLRKVLAAERFEVTCNADFGAVIEACAQPRPGHPESWISHPIIASYRALHEIGHAHSIEVWRHGYLVGGLYGVSFDSVFCGESMFSRADNASKVALAWLVAAMRRGGYRLLDCQFMTDHLATMGAVGMPQADYLMLLEDACRHKALPLPEAYSALSSDAEASGVAPGKLIAQSFTQTS